MPPNHIPTHFLCIPLAGAQLARSLASFRADVINSVGVVPLEAIRPLGTMHLTLGIMSLRSDTLPQAIDTLKSLRLGDILKATSSAGDARLSISLKGLQPMHEASRTSVLYAPPEDPEGSLYRFCEQLRKPFLDSGLMVDENRPLRLHATVVNTVYVKGERGRRKRERIMIDAQDMLTRYDDYVWLEDMPLEKVTLCRMGAKKIEGGEEGDEAYEAVAEVNLGDELSDKVEPEEL